MYGVNPPPPGYVTNPTKSNLQARPFIKIGEEHLSHLSSKQYVSHQQKTMSSVQRHPLGYIG